MYVLHRLNGSTHPINIYFSLSRCSHTFCLDCIILTFQIQRANYTASRCRAHALRANAVKRITDSLKDVPRNNTGFVYQQQLTTVFHHSRFADPVYSCPMCMKAVPIPPAKNFTLNKILDTFCTNIIDQGYTVEVAWHFIFTYMQKQEETF